MLAEDGLRPTELRTGYAATTLHCWTVLSRKWRQFESGPAACRHGTVMTPYFCAIMPECRHSARLRNDRRSPRQASWTAIQAPQMTTAYGSSQSSDWQAPAAKSPASLRRSSASDAAPDGRAARLAAENEALTGARTIALGLPSMVKRRHSVHEAESHRHSQRATPHHLTSLCGLHSGVTLQVRRRMTLTDARPRHWALLFRSAELCDAAQVRRPQHQGPFRYACLQESQGGQVAPLIVQRARSGRRSNAGPWRCWPTRSGGRTPRLMSASRWTGASRGRRWCLSR